MAGETASIGRIATIVEALLLRATLTPDSLAYETCGEGITYGALRHDVQRLAGILAARGLTRGDRCALILPTGLDFIRAAFAIQFLGAAPVAIDPRLPTQAVLRRLHLVRATLALSTRDSAAALHHEAGAALPCAVQPLGEVARGLAPMVRGAAVDSADPAFLQLTSGSTGEPRAVVISHRSLLASLAATADRLVLRGQDVLATWVPLHHDLGLVRYVFGAAYWGCPSHLAMPSLAHLLPWLQLIARVRATITGGPDSAYRLAARTVAPSRIDLTSLRFAGNGGEPVRLSTIEQFEARFGLPGVVRPAYGLAEATLTVTSTAPGEPLRWDAQGSVSCGRALDGIEVRIVSAGGQPVQSGDAGHVLVRGEPVFDGYFGDDEATRLALRDGWLHTGDVGTLDADGHLFLKGRSRLVIKRGGMTIAPREIEDAVDRVRRVETSAAVGVPSESTAATEDIVVIAEVKADAAGSAWRSVVADIARAVTTTVGVAPGRILLVSPGTIPRTPTEKVHYDELRRMILDDALEVVYRS